MAAQQMAKQAEIADSGLGRKELRGQEFTGGFVLQSESGESRAAAFEPAVWAASSCTNSPSRAERTRRWR